MRILGAILGMVVVAIVGLAVFAMLNLRALISVHRDRLVARVEHVIGRPIVVGEVVPSWWPLGVRLREVTIGEDPKFGAEPFLVADGVVLAVRAWPLVHGRIEASGVVLDRPRLTLVRDGEGRWNVESLGKAPSPEELDGGTAKAKERRRTPRIPLEWVVGVALSDVHDGTIVIDDRARRLVLQHVRLHAENVQVGSTARVRLDAAVFAGDRPDLHLDVSVADLGQNDLTHAPFTTRLELVDADLAVLDGWLRRPGFAAGRVRRVGMVASGTLERLQATVELDAADPALRIGALAIGAVESIAVRARAATEKGTLAIEELRATFGTLEVRARGQASQEPRRMALDLTSEAEGAAVVALRGTPTSVSALEGRIVVDREGLALEPLRLRVDGAPLEVRGWVTGIDPLALEVRVEGQPFDGRFAADLTLDAAGAARARMESAGLDLAPAVARFAPELRGRIEGRASCAAVITGRFTAGALTAGSLAGSGTLTVSDGRLRDVNIPDLVVDEIERVPLMPQLVSARTRARYAELFANRDTVIESASVPFTIGRGRLGTDHATLENPAYQITGKGWVDEGQELRFNGTVLLGASVSRTLRDDVRAAKYLAADDGRIMLPFVARGRLGHVWVEPDAKRLRSRGLTALLGQPADEGESAPGDDARRERQPDSGIEERVIERLQRMLRP